LRGSRRSDDVFGQPLCRFDRRGAQIPLVMVLVELLPKDAQGRSAGARALDSGKAIFAVPRINRHLASFAASEASAHPSG